MNVSLSRFKGCVMGALVGDCFGAPFEAMWSPVSVKELNQLDQATADFKPTSESKYYLYYTDDSEMAHGLMRSLIRKKEYDALDVAKEWARTYFSSKPIRSYGSNVPLVFTKLSTSNFECDPYKPAREQFEGSGSYGNGSGMRAFPAALFCHPDMEKLKEISALTAKLTHAHIDGVNGAIMQAAAVSFALSAGQNTKWKDIWEKLHQLAVKVDSKVEGGSGVYLKKLISTWDLLSGDDDFTGDDVRDKIGVGIRASEAIPAAIFAFLCCLAGREPKEFKSFPLFQRCVCYSISLGGDTDTIGTMTGAIVGAYCGQEAIPQHWIQACEGSSEAESLADELYELVKSKA